MALMTEEERLYCPHATVVSGGTEKGWVCDRCESRINFYSPIQIRAFKEEVPGFAKTDGARMTLGIPLESTPELQDIFARLVPEWFNQFSRANAEYGRVNHLGPKGVMPELNRKTAKLLKGIWDGEELRREQPREIAVDMIGHLFLLVHLIDEEAKENGA